MMLLFFSLQQQTVHIAALLLTHFPENPNCVGSHLTKICQVSLDWSRTPCQLGSTIDDTYLIHSAANKNSHSTCLTNEQLCTTVIEPILSHFKSLHRY